MTKAHGEMSGEEGIDVDGGKMSRRKQSRPQHIAKSFEDVNVEEISLDNQLPSDILQVKVTHDDPLTLGVFSRFALPQSRSFGPFKVTPVQEDSEEQHNKEPRRTLKFTNDITVCIESDCGAWLSLLQTTTDKALANTKIVLCEESSVWCELCCDLPEDTQLLTMLIRDTPHNRDSLGNSPPASFSTSRISLDFSQLPAFIYPCFDKGNFGELFGNHCQLPGQQWEYHCQPPEIKNIPKRSSHCEKKDLKETEACSSLSVKLNGKRSTDEREDAPRKLFKSNDGPIRLKPVNHRSSAPTSPQNGQHSPASSSCGSPSRDLSPPITGAFKCQSCSYTADKKSRLIEHMLSHNEETQDEGSPTKIEPCGPENQEKKLDAKNAPDTTPKRQKDVTMEDGKNHVDHEEMDEDHIEEVDGNLPPQDGEWNCEECDISFSSHGTFQAHKNFYCGLRGAKRSRRLSDSFKKKESGLHLQQGYTLLPTMMCPGMIVPTPMMGIPPFVTTYAVPYILPMASPPVAHSTQKITKKRHQEIPLDLSCKKEDEDDMIEVQSAQKAELSPEGDKHKVPTQKVQVKGQKDTENGLSQTPVRKYTMAAAPHSPVIMAARPSVFRCEDCNIVFYKRDNYTVHKELYCAGRRAKTELSSPDSPPHSPSRSLPTSPDSKKSSSSSKSMASPASVRDTTTPDEYTVQYFCIPCKIRFSSPDTLEAHQQYYCPARKVIAEQLAAQASLSCTALSPKSSSEKAICPQCHKCFNTMDDMMKHPCNQATMKIPMFCCPYCEYVAQSDSRLLDHIKAHAPTKAYRCTLCGYRGNTVRGMRMHGKTHIDAGENFTDDHMCELEEPPLIPKRLRTVTESVAINVATEMIKQNTGQFQHRQRSRSVESGNGSLQQVPHICEECNSLFTDTAALQAHMQLHLQEKQDFKCKSCDFIAGVKGELVRHVKMIHENGKVLGFDNKKDLKNSARYTIENLISVKQEKSALPERNNNVSPVKKCISAPAVLDSSIPSKLGHHSGTLSPSQLSPKTSGTEPVSSMSQAGEPPLIGLNTDKCNYCSQCDISFVYRNTYLAHKKYYCSSHIGERNVAPAEV